MLATAVAALSLAWAAVDFVGNITQTLKWSSLCVGLVLLVYATTGWVPRAWREKIGRSEKNSSTGR